MTRAWSNQTKGNDFKSKDDRIRLDIMKKLFIVRVVRHLHRLPCGCPITTSVQGILLLIITVISLENWMSFLMSFMFLMSKKIVIILLKILDCTT